MTPEEIHSLRKSLNLSQEKLAQLLGVSWTTVNRWEAGHSGPTGMAMRILLLLRDRAHDPSLRAILSDPRVHDPLFVLYSLLGHVYSGVSVHRQAARGRIK